MIALWLLLTSLISVKVWPGACMEPCNIQLTLTVEPADDNHMVVVLITAPDSYYATRSEIPYDKGSPKTTYLYYRGIYAGTYTVKVVLYKHDGVTWIAGTDQTQLLVGGHQ